MADEGPARPVTGDEGLRKTRLPGADRVTVAVTYHPLCLEHDPGPQHPERPARLEAIVRELEGEVPAEVEMLTPSAATVEQIASVHTPEHIAQVQRIAAEGGGLLDFDTVLSAASYRAALMGVGTAIAAVEQVLTGAATSAFALPRPPGHHAGPSYGMGFCLFNNAAIAIRQAQRAYRLERILLVDFDVHHGNGSQETFYHDPSVLYFSVHQSPFYPGTGSAEETGSGAGRGFTINVPLPAGSGDAIYARVFQEVLVPVAQRYRPQLIVASAGYDAHWMEPLAAMRVSVAGYSAMAACLYGLAGQLCDGRLAGILEGGYDLAVLAASVMATLRVWTDDAPEDPIGPYIYERREPDVSSIVQRVREIHNLP